MLEGCPLRYHGKRGGGGTNVVGTASHSILCGHWRCAHINSVRGDTLNPPLLGMRHVLSEDVVRRALKRIDERPGLEWLSGELSACVQPVLSQPPRTAPRSGPAHAQRWPAHRQSQREARKRRPHHHGHHPGQQHLGPFHSIAEQWTREQRWTLLLTHIFRRWLGGKWLGHLPPEAEPPLSG